MKTAFAALAPVILGVVSPAARANPSPAVEFDHANLSTGFALQFDEWVLSIQQATVGWSFYVKEPVVVSHLGVYDIAGDGIPAYHRVALWGSDGLLSATTVRPGTDSELIGSWRTESIDPIRLGPGVYTLGAAQLPDLFFPGSGPLILEGVYLDNPESALFVGSGVRDLPIDELFAPSEQFLWNLETGTEPVATDPRITIGESGLFFAVPELSSSQGFSRPDDSLLISGVFIGPNVFFEPIPEPAAAAATWLVICSSLAASRRAH